MAAIVAVPFPAAVTRPDPSTVATASLFDDQATVSPVMTLPFWSNTCAESCGVAPRAASPAVSGDTVTVVGRGAGGVGGAGSVVPSPQESGPSSKAATTSARGAWVKVPMCCARLGRVFLGDRSHVEQVHLRVGKETAQRGRV